MITEDFIDAAYYNKPQVLIDFINQGGDINCYDESGYTALMYAATCGNIDCVNILLKAGANIHYENHIKFNALICSTSSMALMDGSYNTIETHIKCVNALLQAGANIHHTTVNGHTAFTCAAGNGYYEFVKIFLDAGADINHITNDESTPLVLAAKNGNIKIIELLVQMGANLFYKDKLALKSAHNNCKPYLDELYLNREKVWYPELTEYYPNQFKETMEALLIWYNKDCPLPLELVFEIGVQVANSFNNE